MFSRSEKKHATKEKKGGSGITATAYSDLMQSKKVYHLVIAALAITVLVLALMVSRKSTEIVIMPPDYFEPVVVNGNYASQSYAAGHAMGMALMMGNVSPKNINFVTETMLKKLSPRLQVKLGNSLETEAKLIERRRARQLFEVEDVMFRDLDNLVWVWGTKETIIASNTLREPFTYEFRIEPNHGEPKVTHFDAYPGRPKIRSQEPVEVTPYLTRELALVKTFQPGEITLKNTEAESQVTPPTQDNDETGKEQAALNGAESTENTGV